MNEKDKKVAAAMKEVARKSIIEAGDIRDIVGEVLWEKFPEYQKSMKGFWFSQEYTGPIVPKTINNVRFEISGGFDEGISAKWYLEMAGKEFLIGTFSASYDSPEMYEQVGVIVGYLRRVTMVLMNAGLEQES